jgi:hypothetical protein
MSRDLSPVAQQFDRAETYETVGPASFQHSGALLVADAGVLRAMGCSTPPQVPARWSYRGSTPPGGTAPSSTP